MYLFNGQAAPGPERAGPEADACLGMETASRTVAEFKRNGLARETAPNVFTCDLAARPSVLFVSSRTLLQGRSSEALDALNASIV